MHDAHLGYALFFLDMLAEYTLLSMTVMVTPCLWYAIGMNLVCPMSKFPQALFGTRPFWQIPITYSWGRFAYGSSFLLTAGEP